MTNLTMQEKQALEEVFLCFENKKWYEKRICSKKEMMYKILRFYVKKRKVFYKILVLKRRKLS